LLWQAARNHIRRRLSAAANFNNLLDMRQRRQGRLGIVFMIGKPTGMPTPTAQA
jgi:hypothetical protein